MDKDGTEYFKSYYFILLTAKILLISNFKNIQNYKILTGNTSNKALDICHFAKYWSHSITLNNKRAMENLLQRQ